MDQPTAHIPRSRQPEGPTQEIRQPGPPPGAAPPQAAGPSTPPPGPPPGAAPTPRAPEPAPKRPSRWRDPISIVLILVIVVAVLAAALIGAELYVRKAANDAIKKATACKTEDSEDTVDVSFRNTPPVLWQYITNNYPRITVNTHGTRISDLQGATIDVIVDDIDMNGDATKSGTIGAIDATLNWTTTGILDTVRESLNNLIPDELKAFTSFISLDSFVTDVKTDPSAGTVTVEGAFDVSITVQPKAENGDLRLVIPENGIKVPIGSIPRESLQETLDEKTKEINDNDLGIKVTKAEVTNDAVILEFGAQNSTVPTGGTDPCFADL